LQLGPIKVLAQKNEAIEMTHNFPTKDWCDQEAAGLTDSHSSSINDSGQVVHTHVDSVAVNFAMIKWR